MSKPKIVVNTKMTKDDNRKFLYFSTFKKNKFAVPLILLISLIISILIGYSKGILNTNLLVKSWVLLIALMIILNVLNIEFKNRMQLRTDKVDNFNTVNTLSFYDDKFVVENKSVKAKGELAYNQFIEVIENKDYFVLYISPDQASLIRKKDIKNINEFREFIIEKFGSRYRKS